MKKRIWVVGGSMGAGVILVLAMLSTVVSAQTVKSTEVRTNIAQYFKDKISNNNSTQDCIFVSIFAFIVAFFLILNGSLRYMFY